MNIRTAAKSCKIAPGCPPSFPGPRACLTIPVGSARVSPGPRPSASPTARRGGCGSSRCSTSSRGPDAWSRPRPLCTQRHSREAAAHRPGGWASEHFKPVRGPDLR
ncbi:hypothetical protein CG736_33930 [Kitasatospora sp. CB02891]|nr:hypothetical protein CG736_33930 [Kitasatospora sp. CB02891]